VLVGAVGAHQVPAPLQVFSLPNLRLNHTFRRRIPLGYGAYAKAEPHGQIFKFRLAKQPFGLTIGALSEEDVSAQVTVLLCAINRGDAEAASRLVPLVYRELRRLAASYMRRERPDHTLQPTALVHEAYLKLVEQRAVNWQSRAHFFGVAAQLMRRILIDHARGHLRQKRGGEIQKVSLDEALAFFDQRAEEVLAVDESLQRLAHMDPRQARVVEMRFFAGLSVEEVAEVLQVSRKTVKRDWSVAKAWLYADLKERHGIDARTMGEG
jgi:RNA polymerase sigma-70 factor, ECF subfamily